MSSDILYQAEGSAAIRLEYDDDVGGDPKKKKKLHLAVMCFTKEAHLLHMAFYNNRHISGTTEESDGAEGDVPRCVSLRSTTSQDGDQATKEVAELHFAHVPNDVVVMAVVVFCVAGNDFSPLAVDDRSVASTCVQVTRPDGASFIRHPLGSSSLRRDSGGLSPRSRPVAMFGVYFDRRCTKRSQWELAIEAATISGLSWEPIVTSVRNTVGLGRLGEMRVPPGRKDQHRLGRYPKGQGRRRRCCMLCCRRKERAYHRHVLLGASGHTLRGPCPQRRQHDGCRRRRR